MDWKTSKTSITHQTILEPMKERIAKTITTIIYNVIKRLITIIIIIVLNYEHLIFLQWFLVCKRLRFAGIKKKYLEITKCRVTIKFLAH